MAHDGSNASRVEDWIVEAVREIREDAQLVFEPSEVLPFAGTETTDPHKFTEELFSGHRDLVCRVLYYGDRVQPLNEGEIAVVPTFLIVVGIRNQRPMTARRGDGTTIGTNRIRDLLRYALHDVQPTNAQTGAIIQDGVTAVERLVFRGSQLSINDGKRCVQQTTIEVEESPVPS